MTIVEIGTSTVQSLRSSLISGVSPALINDRLMKVVYFGGTTTVGCGAISLLSLAVGPTK
jgi:hypothetical protein